MSQTRVLARFLIVIMILILISFLPSVVEASKIMIMIKRKPNNRETNS